MNPSASPLYAAAVAFLGLLLDALTVFHVFQVTAEQRTVLLGLFSALFVLASLLVPLFYHSNGQLVATQAHEKALAAISPPAKAA